MLPNDNILASVVMALMLFGPPAQVAAAGEAETAIRAALGKWMQDFNAGRADAVCALFAPDLRYDFRGYAERGYEDICSRLRRSLADDSKTYRYDLDIREIIVSGDLAVVRLAWTLTVTLGNGQSVTSVEPGMDVLRKEPDGSWRIIRYMAYEMPKRGTEGP